MLIQYHWPGNVRGHRPSVRDKMPRRYAWKPRSLGDAHERRRRRGLCGCKEATGEVERVARLRALYGEEFLLYSGVDATAREFMLAGGDGVVLSLRRCSA